MKPGTSVSCEILLNCSQTNLAWSIQLSLVSLRKRNFLDYKGIIQEDMSHDNHMVVIPA